MAKRPHCSEAEQSGGASDGGGEGQIVVLGGEGEEGTLNGRDTEGDLLLALGQELLERKPTT